MFDTHQLVARIEALARSTGASPSTLSRKLFGNGTRIDEIRAGGSLTIATYKRVMAELEAIETANRRTHDGTSAVDDDAPAPEGCMSGPERTWELTDDELASLPDADPDLRVVICAVCEQRLDERHVRACQAQDCPHAQREAA